MNIGQIPFIDFPSIGSALNAFHGGRVSLPVAPGMYIYSQFRHVSGVPAPEGIQGLSINKLHILDSILGELARMREMPKPSFDVHAASPENQFNSLLEFYQGQVQETYKANSDNPYYFTAPQTGASLNIQM
jgi:hypothetical protein